MSRPGGRRADGEGNTHAQPDPLVETVALLEQLCRDDGDCDPALGCDLDCGSFAVPPTESQLNQTVRLN